MNKVFLIGRLTRDPELTETSAGVNVCRFSIAVNRDYTQNGERPTDFFNCTAWRGQAENTARYAHKGDKIAVEGSVEMKNYEDREGNKRSSVVVQAARVEFLETKREENTEATETAAPKKPALQSFDDDGDIPF